MFPVSLEIELTPEIVVPAILIPKFTSETVPVVPDKTIGSPLLVEIIPALAMLIPCEAAVVLAPPAPVSVTVPPLELSFPEVIAMPWQAPVVPAAEAVMVMAPLLEKVGVGVVTVVIENPLPPLP